MARVHLARGAGLRTPGGLGIRTVTPSTLATAPATSPPGPTAGVGWGGGQAPDVLRRRPTPGTARHVSVHATWMSLEQGRPILRSSGLPQVPPKPQMRDKPRVQGLLLPKAAPQKRSLVLCGREGVQSQVSTALCGARAPPSGQQVPHSARQVPHVPCRQKQSFCSGGCVGRAGGSHTGHGASCPEHAQLQLNGTRQTTHSKEGPSEEAHFHRHTNGEAAVKTLDTSGHRRSAGRGLRGTAGWRGRGGPGAPRTTGGCGAAATPHCAAPPKATVTARPRRRGHGEASAERGGNTSAETCPRASPWRGARQPPGGDRARVHPHGAVSLGHGKGQALTLVTRGRSSNTRRSARDAGCARPRGVRLHRGKRQNRRVRRQEAGEWVSGDGVGSEASFR